MLKLFLSEVIIGTIVQNKFAETAKEGHMSSLTESTDDLVRVIRKLPGDDDP